MGNAPSSAVLQPQVAAVDEIRSVDENLDLIKATALELYGWTGKFSVVRYMDTMVRVVKRTTAREDYPRALNLLADFLEEEHKKGTLYRYLCVEFDTLNSDFHKNIVPKYCKVTA
jgi:hypothetical protein